MANKVRISITLREYAVIAKLRKIQFGCLEVYKENGVVERIVIRENKKINEEDGLKEMSQELSSIAFVGDNSIIEEEEVSLTYGEEKTLKS